MTRFKDFGSGDNAVTEPLQFSLHGETFDCRPALQGQFLLELVGRSSGDDASSSANAVTSFFAEVLLPESYERFQELTMDPDRIVSVETLSEIVGWLVGEYTDRPTEPRVNSSNGE